MQIAAVHIRVTSGLSWFSVGNVYHIIQQAWNKITGGLGDICVVVINGQVLLGFCVVMVIAGALQVWDVLGTYDD